MPLDVNSCSHSRTLGAGTKGYAPVAISGPPTRFYGHSVNQSRLRFVRLTVTHPAIPASNTVCMHWHIVMSTFTSPSDMPPTFPGPRNGKCTMPLHALYRWGGVHTPGRAYGGLRSDPVAKEKHPRKGRPPGVLFPITMDRGCSALQATW